jgi:hypothetical protein
MQKRNGAPDEDGAPGNNNHTALYASSGDRATKTPKQSASKSPLRRSVKKRRTPKPVTREVALYDGQTLVAVIRVGGDGNCIAFDGDDKRLGSYPTFQAATNALNAARGGRG